MKDRHDSLAWLAPSPVVTLPPFVHECREAVERLLQEETLAHSPFSWSFPEELAKTVRRFVPSGLQDQAISSCEVDRLQLVYLARLTKYSSSGPGKSQKRSSQ